MISLAAPAFLIAILVRVRIALRITAWVAPLRAVGQILRVAERLVGAEPKDEPTTTTLRRCLPELRLMKRLSWWMGRNPAQSDLGTLSVEYLNWFLCLDGLAMLLADREVRRHAGAREWGLRE